MGETEGTREELEEGRPREGQDKFPPCSQATPRCQAVCKQSLSVTNEIQRGPIRETESRSFVPKSKADFI